jgi:hypothetical protein
MPKKRKRVHLCEHKVGDSEPIRAVTSTFRSAYEWAKFAAKIAKPNWTEREAREVMKRLGSAVVYDTDRFDSPEAAMYRQDGETVRIHRFPVL